MSAPNSSASSGSGTSVSARFWRRKSADQALAEADGGERGLRRTLNAADLAMLGIGAILGAGIFSSTGQMAAGTADQPGAGPALVISYLLTAVACGFAALCYAEIAAMVPAAGSAYTYAYATIGQLVAFIIGWDLFLEFTIGAAAVSVGFAGYLNSFLDQVFG
ncbi:MAG TPA: amino acid permease, partial [Polyangia bacterium]